MLVFDTTQNNQIKLKYREGTTRYIQVHCKTTDGTEFNLDGYTATTFLDMGGTKTYLPTTILGSSLVFKIPPEISVGKFEGRSETRLYKDSDVISVVVIDYDVMESPKPDIVPVEL